MYIDCTLNILSRANTLYSFTSTNSNAHHIGSPAIVGFLNLPFRANFYPMTGLSGRYYDDLLTDLGEGRLGGPLERPTDP